MDNGLRDKMLAEEWLEELADAFSMRKYDAESEGEMPKSETIAAYNKARARLRLMSKLYAALCTEDGE